jgi:hypothetical protein
MLRAAGKRLDLPRRDRRPLSMPHGMRQPANPERSTLPPVFIATHNDRAVQRSIHDSHTEDRIDATEGDAMPTI